MCMCQTYTLHALIMLYIFFLNKNVQYQSTSYIYILMLFEKSI